MMKYDDYARQGIIWGGVFWERKTTARLENEKCLEQFGYKVYSQNDEDGIIQEIFKRIGTTNKYFIEFGVQDGLESNGHYLLLQGWSGLWLEGDARYVEQINNIFHPVIESGQLKCKCAFITRDNINDLIREQGIRGEIDLLSIDIDGNDYYVWDAIAAVKPRVVVIEYNGKFPPDCNWKMAYNESHVWDGSDWHGASLKALELLGEKLGYQLVGTNIQGANAFFVRRDLADDKFYTPATAEELYNPLRLDIRHCNGHSARYCLKDQKEGYGVLNYCPDETAVAVYGFHEKEGCGEREYRWISDARSCILVRRFKATNTIVIPYFVNGEALNARNALGDWKIKVSLDGAGCDACITEPEGTIEIALPPTTAEVVTVKIETNHLWRPSDVLGAADNRWLGIAVVFSGIRIV